MNLRVQNVAHGDRVIARGAVVQCKTDQPIGFELTEQTRDAVQLILDIPRKHSPLLRIEVDDTLEIAEQTEV